MKAVTEQARLAFLHSDMKRKERKAKEMCADVRQWIDDGYDVSPTLQDAIKLSPSLLTLPANWKRFGDLYSDAFTSIREV